MRRRKTASVQQTELTNDQFDTLRTRGAKTPFGLVGPSPSRGISLALLARGDDPEAFLRKMRITRAEKQQLRANLREWTPSSSLILYLVPPQVAKLPRQQRLLRFYGL